MKANKSVFSNLFVLLVALAAPLVAQANDLSIIPDASYYVVSNSNTKVSFYDADGNFITQMNTGIGVGGYYGKSRLDPNAPKPKVATYAIKWHPAYSMKIFWHKAYMGIPHWNLILKDKHGNEIGSYAYNRATKTVNVYAEINDTGNFIYKKIALSDLKDFNMSNCVEKESDKVKLDRRGCVKQVITSDGHVYKLSKYEKQFANH